MPGRYLFQAIAAASACITLACPNNFDEDAFLSAESAHCGTILLQTGLETWPRTVENPRDNDNHATDNATTGTRSEAVTPGKTDAAAEFDKEYLARDGVSYEKAPTVATTGAIPRAKTRQEADRLRNKVETQSIVVNKMQARVRKLEEEEWDVSRNVSRTKASYETAKAEAASANKTLSEALNASADAAANRAESCNERDVQRRNFERVQPEFEDANKTYNDAKMDLNEVRLLRTIISAGHMAILLTDEVAASNVTLMDRRAEAAQNLSQFQRELSKLDSLRVQKRVVDDELHGSSANRSSRPIAEQVARPFFDDPLVAEQEALNRSVYEQTQVVARATALESSAREAEQRAQGNLDSSLADLARAEEDMNLSQERLTTQRAVKLAAKQKRDQLEAETLRVERLLNASDSACTNYTAWYDRLKESLPLAQETSDNTSVREQQLAIELRNATVRQAELRTHIRDERKLLAKEEELLIVYEGTLKNLRQETQRYDDLERSLATPRDFGKVRATPAPATPRPTPRHVEDVEDPRRAIRADAAPPLHLPEPIAGSREQGDALPHLALLLLAGVVGGLSMVCCFSNRCFAYK